MSFVIAAAGTGGHIYPGLAVAEALVTAGVASSEVLFVGGNRLESEVYPAAGFPFHPVELRGLARRLTPDNLAIPAVIWRATRTIERLMARHGVKAVMGMGGYVTGPAGLAARRRRVPLLIAEQNARAGLANRLSQRMATRVFGSFPVTVGLARAEWVGNPIRGGLTAFDRLALRGSALTRYRLPADRPVVGMFGGSLGAGVLNRAAFELANSHLGGSAPAFSLLHLVGPTHVTEVSAMAEGSPIPWRVVGFEREMELFYAACDLVVSRAGGAVAELTATYTPAILVPGGFGSAGHQQANAAVLVEAGAAEMIKEGQLSTLPSVVHRLLDPSSLARMAAACAGLAQPKAAATIADALVKAHG
ncbi:MAG: UDP-N-acetylglucosamine--N-acetylmuramyl-(pentapeptide) pyrophosphoryl-undecaprenol N-acetylglucosamine transferase [Actinomycetota bacterium]